MVHSFPRFIRTTLLRVGVVIIIMRTTDKISRYLNYSRGDTAGFAGLTIMNIEINFHPVTCEVAIKLLYKCVFLFSNYIKMP